jgi:sulfur relay (sulfurtransferase) DsrC/TusE family protein
VEHVKKWNKTLHESLRKLKIPFDPKHTGVVGFTVSIYTNDRGAPKVRWMLKRMGMKNIRETDGSHVSKDYPVLFLAKSK